MQLVHDCRDFMCITISFSRHIFQVIDLEVPDFPKEPERGSHNISLGPLLYIERSDFMEGGQKGFRRLTPDQPVGLKYTSSTISMQHMVKVGTIVSDIAC